MRQSSCLFLFLMLMASVSATRAADTITLKRSGIGGWSYSTDGVAFSNVGFYGGALANALTNNGKANLLMQSYKANRVAVTVTGVAAVGLFVGAAFNFAPENPNFPSIRTSVHGPMIWAIPSLPWERCQPLFVLSARSPRITE